jgi:HK97 gp10 family phage protein
MLKSRLPAIIAGLDPRVETALRAGAELVEAEAKTRAPDRPPIGEGLVEAIHVEPDDVGGGYFVVAGDSDVFYGHFLEHGTRHAAARPFLVPALESQSETVAAMVHGVLKTL